MSKKMLRDVVISSICFLLLIWLAFTWAQKYLPMDTPVSSKEQKIAYLTFDDGPSVHTKEVLDILKKYQVKATFFVTGTNPQYYDMIKETYQQGHAIGVHTFSHDYDKIYSSEEAYFKDIDKANDMIKKQIGHKVTLLRFPGGSSNTVSRKYQEGIMTSLSKAVLDKGYQYYDWNASNGDGNCYVDSSSLINIAMKEIRGKDEVMVLMHDGTGNKATVEALPTILQSMVKQGFQFKVIDQKSTPVFHHKIAN